MSEVVSVVVLGICQGVEVNDFVSWGIVTKEVLLIPCDPKSILHLSNSKLYSNR